MSDDRNAQRRAARRRRNEPRRITYRIVVSGRDDEHALEEVAEWCLEAITSLFEQEGWDIKGTEPPIISQRLQDGKDG